MRVSASLDTFQYRPVQGLCWGLKLKPQQDKIGCWSEFFLVVSRTTRGSWYWTEFEDTFATESTSPMHQFLAIQAPSFRSSATRASVSSAGKRKPKRLELQTLNLLSTTNKGFLNISKSPKSQGKLKTCSQSNARPEQLPTLGASCMIGDAISPS